MSAKVPEDKLNKMESSAFVKQKANRSVDEPRLDQAIGVSMQDASRNRVQAIFGGGRRSSKNNRVEVAFADSGSGVAH